MSKLVGQRKVFYFVILIIAALMLNFTTIVLAAPGSNSVEMSVKAGYDDVVRVGSAAPFHITLVNKGDGFSGEAQVIIDTGYRTKTNYTITFELPKGSTKEITLDVPVMTANRKVQIKIESNKRTIKDVEYSFKKILSPEVPTIGVLSDAPNELRALNGLRLAQNQSNMDYRYKAKFAPGGAASTNEVSAEMIQLNKDSLPDSDEELTAFDYIVIADYDTSLLSKKQVQGLEKWVDSGNALILSGGTNGKKVISGLGNALKPFEILGIKKVSLLEGLKKLTEKKVPEALADVSAINVGKGIIFMGDEINPLAVSYEKSEGKIIFISFDPTLSPVADWESAGEMWKKLLGKSIQAVDSRVFNNGNNYYEYGSVATQVPEDQTPPYKTLLIIIVIYILLVGPLLYLLLKWKDKRDYNWVIVPVMALLCLGIIYAAGFRTRYTSAVLNNFSIINLDSKDKKADIQTISGAFNNGSGKMTLEYPNSYGLEVRRQNDYNYGYNFNYNPEDYKNAVVNSKVYIGEPVKNELYNLGLWEPCVLRAKQTQSYNGNLIEKVSISGNKFSAVIKNNTGFALEDSFIVLGANFVEVGDILPNQEKKVDISLDDKSLKKSFGLFLDSRYFNFGTVKPNYWPKDWKDEMRRRNALENTFNYVLGGVESNSIRGTKLAFFALNFDNIDYGIKINGKKAKTYNTNVVFANEDLEFEKGKRVEISEGIIGATFEGGENIEFQGNYNEDVFIYNDTDAFYRFDIPQDVIVDRFKIDWSASIPEYIKEKYNQGGAAQNEASGASYKLFVYNNVLKDWESINQVFEPKGAVSAYINELGEIKLKVSVDIDESKGQQEYLWKPEISLNGVKK